MNDKIPKQVETFNTNLKKIDENGERCTSYVSCVHVGRSRGSARLATQHLPQRYAHGYTRHEHGEGGVDLCKRDKQGSKGARE